MKTFYHSLAVDKVANLSCNYIMSLGNHCHTSYALKTASLKHFSCPFDWIFANINVVTDCLATHFQELLDPKQFCAHGKPFSARQAGHYKYGRELFNHHDPRTPADYSYLTRCVQRFRTVSRDNSKWRVYVHFALHGSITQVEATNLLQSLISYGAKQKVVLLVINHKVKPTVKMPRYRIQRRAYTATSNVDTRDAYIITITLTTLSRSNGVTFSNPEDNALLDRILKSLFTYNLLHINDLHGDSDVKIDKIVNVTNVNDIMRTFTQVLM